MLLAGMSSVLINTTYFASRKEAEQLEITSLVWQLEVVLKMRYGKCLGMHLHLRLFVSVVAGGEIGIVAVLKKKAVISVVELDNPNDPNSGKTVRSDTIHNPNDPIQSVSPTEKLTQSEIDIAALEEHGCFIAIHDDVEYSLEKRSEIFQGSLPELFDLPLEIKSKYTRDGPFATHVGPKSTMPLYEGLSITDSTNPAAVERFSHNFWPSGNPKFCDMTNFVANKFSTLTEIVSRMVLESYGVEKHLNDFLGSMIYRLMFIKYRVSFDSNELNIGLRPHTDKGFVTVIDQNGVDGLEIQTKQNWEWISVDFPTPPPSCSSVFVIAGESLKAWSNGRIHPVLHRVTMNVKKERYTIAQFSYPILEKLVYAPEEIIDDEHPHLYKPLDPYELRRFSHSLQGKIVHDLLKTYCGV